jgi:hypothetical protein
MVVAHSEGRPFHYTHSDGLVSSSGSLAIFTAICRASLRMSNLFKICIDESCSVRNLKNKNCFQELIVRIRC